MAYTAQEPLTEAKYLLNDPSGAIYPDNSLLPLMQKAYRELQQEMQINGLPVLKELSAVVTVNAGITFLGDGSGLPDDFVSPIDLAERTPSSAELWQDMFEQDWEPDVIAGPRLTFWNFREEQIKFVGATANREVRIKYMKGLPRITATTTPIQVIGAESYLAARTASIAALVLGSNPTRAAALNADAGEARTTLIAILVRRGQSLPIRRRVNRFRR